MLIGLCPFLFLLCFCFRHNYTLTPYTWAMATPVMSDDGSPEPELLVHLPIVYLYVRSPFKGHRDFRPGLQPPTGMEMPSLSTTGLSGIEIWSPTIRVVQTLKTRITAQRRQAETPPNHIFLQILNTIFLEAASSSSSVALAPGSLQSRLASSKGHQWFAMVCLETTVTPQSPFSLFLFKCPPSVRQGDTNPAVRHLRGPMCSFYGFFLWLVNEWMSMACSVFFGALGFHRVPRWDAS